jgi:xanthine dehydrogenase YagR molybdenum-binding subunit
MKPSPKASRFEDYSETVVNWSGQLYQCKNVELGYKIAPLDVCTPCDMRAPGAAWGLFALESAMDELAYKLQMDPLELRLKNYAEKDLESGKRFSSKELPRMLPARRGAFRLD